MRHGLASLALSLTLLGAGCGGGGGGDGGAAPFLDIPITIPLSDERSGSISSAGTVIQDQSLLIGDTGIRTEWRGMYTFGIPMTAQGFRIQSATLEFTLDQVFGTPFTSLGMHGAIATGVDMTTPTLDASYFAGHVLAGDAGSRTLIDVLPHTPGRLALNVIALVGDAGDSPTLRYIGIRFSFFLQTDDDAQADGIRLGVFDMPPPQLVLDYERE